ncbi:hypothetical protein JTB14_001356 [Gonioctena quinquepunctata]|nr:hypothetical protein JTB14_001356 [Gonioctena quinquepunctata]
MEEKKVIYAFSTLEAGNEEDWYLDSCASSHLTANETWLEDTSECRNIQIVVANNTKMSAKITGNVKIPIHSGIIEARDVSHVPDIAANLLTVSRITQQGHSVKFT